MTPLRVDRRGTAAIVTIARPDRGNSLSRDTLTAFAAAGARLAADDSVRAVVITGEGDRVFCAGADLKERGTMSRDAVLAQLRAYRSDLGWLAEPNLVTVAAINGAALGGGLELAMLCDLRVAHEHAALGLPETGLGIIPGAGGTQRLPRLIGEARAKELILLGRRLSATEALHWGLVHRVVRSSDDLVADALSWLRPVLDGAPIAQRAALEAIAASEQALAAGLEREVELYERCLDSTDRLEALAAFAEKRKPAFRGK